MSGESGAGTHELELKVIMMGPSRVGKTTLLTAMLADTKAQLAKSTVDLKPADTPTKRRVRANNEELQSELFAGEFTGAGLKGTEEVTTYSFALTPGVEGNGVRITFMDFPGTLLGIDAQERSGRDWKKVEDFQARSTAMVIPVDATVIMEAYLPDHRRQWPRLLGLEAVQDAATEWAMRRNEAKGEPALLVLAPVKCESYFVDNGGTGKDRSAQLRGLVLDEVYAKLIRSVRNEFDDPEALRLLYCPVDSIGCVEVERALWEQGDAELGPRVTFRVRRPAHRSVLGADGLLAPIVRHAVEVRRQLQERVTKEAKEKRRRAEQDRDRRRPFFEDIWDWMTGAAEERSTLAKATSEAQQLEARRLEEFERVLKDLAERPLGARAIHVRE